MGEALLAREMHVRGMLSRRADAALLWPVVEKLGRQAKSKGKKRAAEAVFTDDAKLLNLAVDYRLNELWAYEQHDEYRTQLQLLLEEHASADKDGLLQELLDATPKCLLHTAHEAPLATLGPLLDYSVPSADLPPEAVWNCAVLYQVKKRMSRRRRMSPGEREKTLPCLTTACCGARRPTRTLPLHTPA